MASFYQLTIDSKFPYLSIVSVFGKDLAFCRFESITIPESVTDIGDLIPVTGLGIVMLAKDLQCAKIPDYPQDGDEHRTSKGRHRHRDSRDSHARQRLAMCKDIPDNPKDGDEHRILNGRHGYGDSRDSHARQKLASAKTPDNPQDGDEHRIFNGRHRHGDSRDVMLAKDLQCAKIPDYPQDGDEHRTSKGRHRHWGSRDSHARQRLAMCAKATDNPLDRHEHQIFNGRDRLGDGHAFQRRNFQRQCHRLRDCHRDHLISVIKGRDVDLEEALCMDGLVRCRLQLKE